MSEDARQYRPGLSGRRVPVLIALAASVLVTAVLVTACGSGSGGQAAASAVSASCTQISAMLSDGPDPGSDPVGYAEAQIRPLRALHIPQAGLRSTVGRLAGAYAAVFASNDKSAAAGSELKAAVAALNKVCPDSGAGA
jgi:hypothetical protein